MSEHNGGYAFPNKDDFRERCNGMTLRDYFAAKAMQGLLAGFDGPECPWVNDDLTGLTGYSYQIADAMLKARVS